MTQRFDRRGGRDEPSPRDWTPKTELGRLVKAGQISTMGQALRTGLPLREPEVVDILLPNLEDDVIDVNMVQRMTDSGRRVRFRVTAVVGNRDGYVGIGQARGKEVGPTIRRAIDAAKLNIIEIRRGAGSWESGRGAPPTSLPFEAKGKCGATEVILRPAPQGTGLVTGDVAKQVLRLAGVQDVWSFARGQTKTTINYAKATFNALQATSGMRVMPHLKEKLAIREGSVVQ
ncbi:MAG TPA: 30S ribosomal protein S5 [Candidatus Thermoplasmatota archaeon]|nr:30S ribosomal protein S5 [Candidatus Thermoplasmatota archaeon]